MAGLGFMFKGKLFPPAQVTTDFTNKIVLVTGSNTGLGYQAALKYVQLGASIVVLGVRSLEKGQRAASAIEAASGRRGVVQVWELDMSNFSSVDNFARRVDKDLARLDVALLNAGVVTKAYTLSPDGWETMMQVNLLSTALLSLLLLPKLKASRNKASVPHLTLVASTGHMDCTPRRVAKANETMLQSYNKKEGFQMMDRYGLSKLFEMWFTRELAARLLTDVGPDVIVNDVCPGGCSTEAMRDFSGPFTDWLISLFQFLMLRTAEQGSRTLVSATTLGKESHGRWWRNDKLEVEGRYITGLEGKEMAKEMWDDVIKILREKVPRVEDVLQELR